MTAADMTAFLAQMSYSRYRAAKELGVTTQAVINWEQGTTPISKVVALACAAKIAGLAPFPE